MRPTILTIAGSDSSGGAGIQADLKAIEANGGYGATVLAAITAQNTRGVIRAETVSPSMLGAQLDAVFDDLEVAAVKTGMLATTEIITAVAGGLRRHRPPRYVCDPVMISKSGFALLAAESIEALKKELLPLATLVTPNRHEAEALTGIEVSTLRQAEEAGRRILDLGPQAVLVKGGHLTESPATDVFVSADETRLFHGEFIHSPHTHGTGCTYSAAIATHLGRGLALGDAIALSKEFLTEAIRGGLPVGQGNGPTDPFFFLRGPEAAARWLKRLLSH